MGTDGPALSARVLPHGSGVTARVRWRSGGAALAQRDGITQPWGTRTPYGFGVVWSVRVDSHLAEGLTAQDVDRWVRSAAVLHSNGDGLDIAVKDGEIVGVRGRADDRVNRGRLDPKDLFGWLVGLLLVWLFLPMIRRDGELVEASWDEALTLVVGF